MAYTRKQLRQLLARSVGQYFSGTVDSGSTTTIVDTELARWATDDALIGAWVYITAAGAAAPEGEYRRVSDYTASSKTLTVDPAFTATTQAGDTYDLFLAPLSIEDWDDCINAAIREAWPLLYEAEYYESDYYLNYQYMIVPVASTGIEEILLVSYSTDARAGNQYFQVIPSSHYYVDGLAGSNLYIRWRFERPFAGTGRLQVMGKKRLAEMATDAATTTVDPAYIIAQGRAEYYQRMSDKSRVQAEQGSYLQLMNHWQQRADQKKLDLARTLEFARVPERQAKSGK